MKETIVSIRNKINRFLYQKGLKPILFRVDPEKVHDKFTHFGEFLGSNPITRWAIHSIYGYSNPSLRQTIAGIDFPNPVGLAAGFDKNANLTEILPHIGFGFAEIGSFTGEPCEGNPKPRLWRLPESEGLVVWYGLKNDGAIAISERLRDKKFKFPIGISVAKTNSLDTCETEAGIADYVKAYKAFENIGNYDTINISCPNTYGGEPLTDTHKLEKLLKALNEVRNRKPMFVKLSPDLTEIELDKIIEIAQNHNVDGFICTNLTKKINRSSLSEKNIPNKGGISGRIVQRKSNNQIRYIYKKTNGKSLIIGVGGIFNAEDAYEKIKYGASLVQMITGMIFEGPQLISEINKGLVKLLDKDGYSNISDAIGTLNT